MAAGLFLCLYDCSYCQALPLLFPLQWGSALTQFSSMTVERKVERCFTAPCFHPGVCVCYFHSLFCLPVNQSSVGLLTHTHNPEGQRLPPFLIPLKAAFGSWTVKADVSMTQANTPDSLMCFERTHVSWFWLQTIHRCPVWECTGWQIKETFPSVWNGSQTSLSQNALKPHPVLNKEKAIFHPKIKWIKNNHLYLK